MPESEHHCTGLICTDLDETAETEVLLDDDVWERLETDWNTDGRFGRAYR